MNRLFTSRRAAAAVALLCAVALFAGINFIADRTLGGERVDLTQQHLYTLAQGSKATLAKIDEPVVLRFYYSKRLGDEVPAYGLYAQRVRELLEEYAARSHGKLRLEEINPVPFSPEEDRAVAFGLQGVPIDQGGELVYFGLAATNSTDDQQVIPFFQMERERFLEYDLTRLVYNLAFPKKPVVALITSLPLEGDMMAAMQGQPMQPFVVLEQLRQLYDIRTLGGDIDSIDKDVDVVWIAHPQHLSEKTQYAIDQFVLRGGHALVFVDPNSEVQSSRPSRFNPPGSPNDSNLEKLFAAWGVEMLPDTVAGDRFAARKVNAGSGSRVVPADYVAWLSLRQPNFNHDDPVTSDLTQINMASAGILEQKQGATTKFEPLITTSPASMKIPAEKVKGMPDIVGLLRGFKPDDKRYVLAARITGPAKTAFPDGPPKPPEKKDAENKDTKKDAEKPAEPAPQLTESAKPINVIVVADTDILDDRFWVQAQDFFGQRAVTPTANNGDFVANAVESLAGGAELMTLRSRGISSRPFELVQDIQRDAEQRYSAKEKALQDKLKETEAKIKDARVVKEGQGQGQAGIVLTSEQTQAVDNFRAELVRTRQQLREVQLALRQDIDRLKFRLEFFNIALVPILVGIAALVLGIVRLRRRSRRAAHA
jgi:gliding motility-associatede transport system auxiliary component